MLGRTVRLTATAAGNVTGNHDLGYTPVTWWLVRQSNGTAFSAAVASVTSTQVTVNFSGAGTVDVYVA